MPSSIRISQAAAVTTPVQISVLALVGVTLLDTHVVRLVKVVR